MEKSRPHVILSAAISVDGKIATKTGDSKLSSKQDSIRLHKLRSKVDAILVGKNTVAIDDPLLTVRHTKGKNPIRIILDSKGTLSDKSKILQTSDKITTIIVVSKKISKSNYNRLSKFPVKLLVIGVSSVNLKSLLRKLSDEKIKTILVEGGGTINWEFIKQNIFDELIITLSPFLIGGNNAISFVEGEGFDNISKSPNLRLKSVKRLKNHLVLLDDPLLTVRHTKGKNPIRIVLDSKGTLSDKSKILQTSDKIKTIIVVSKKITKSNYNKLNKFPVELIVTGDSSVNIKSLLRKLFTKKIKTILVEGGGTINWEFIKHNIFDELIVTLSPFLVGGNNAISFVEGDGFDKISKSPNLRLKSVKRLKNHLVLHYAKV